MKNNIEWVKYNKLILERPKLFAKNHMMEIVLDENIINEFELERKVKIGVVYESPYHFLVVDLIKTEHDLYTYERIIPVNSGAIITVPTNTDKKFILLKQFRHSYRDMEYSFPRGFGEKNISEIDNVKKEIKEEIGGVTNNITYLGKIALDSGLIANIVDIYSCCIDSYDVNKQDEGIVDIVLLTKEEVEDWIVKGKIVDSCTISAFYLYIQNML